MPDAKQSDKSQAGGLLCDLSSFWRNDNTSQLCPQMNLASLSASVRITEPIWRLMLFTLQHVLTQAAVAYLLQLSTSAAKYRTPYLLEPFIKDSESSETRKVDCCRNGCFAYAHKRALQTECVDCGAPRHEAGGRTAIQITYFLLTSLRHKRRLSKTHAREAVLWRTK